MPTMIRDTYFYPFEGSKLRELCVALGAGIKEYPENIFKESAISGHDNDREVFEDVIKRKYSRCSRNMNYLERIE